ncbi:hypothetical protein BKA69DRAFT_771096 [Paraphysoderma sedebokerense]|nr:hypothetical protein BKA69DRAFT_771096 [Paraphysoderma sedebokerense]
MLLQKLLSLVQSDERIENRLKAVYLLGQLGDYIGRQTELSDLMITAFKQLIINLTKVRRRTKIQQPSSGFDQTMKCYLFNALGKYLRKMQTCKLEWVDLILYMIYSEFKSMRTSSQPEDLPQRERTHAFYFTRILLMVLVNDLEPTERNRSSIGSMFKNFIIPLIKSPDNQLQTLAIQFVSTWLPITDQGGPSLGYETLLNGLEEQRNLSNSNLDPVSYHNEWSELKESWRHEQARLASRNRILRRLLLMPGTHTTFEPVSSFPGFFVDVHSTLIHTLEIVTSLPVHPNSAISLYRAPVAIPGVPANATTVPPVFMDPTWAQQAPPPQSKYELCERAGYIPGLPIGYTYSPGPFLDLPSVNAGASSSETPGWRKDIQSMEGREIVVLPAGMTTEIPIAEVRTKRDVPPGFLLTCPYAGNDSDNNDRMKPSHNSKSIMLKRLLQLESSLDGYTFNRLPLIWPQHEENLKSVLTPSDFPLNALIVFEIDQPNRHRTQRLLTKVCQAASDLGLPCIQSLEKNLLCVGSRFNIYFRGRKEADKWITVQLEILDNDYEDDMLIPNKHLPSTLNSDVNSQAVSAGYTSQNEPYWAPPVNILSTPAGYTKDGKPYFGRSPTIKPIPSAMTNFGQRYYPTPELLPSEHNGSDSTHILAGYDYNGQPFFIPKGCKIPSPTGFSHAGLPYYDIFSIILQPGVIRFADRRKMHDWIDSIYRKEENCNHADDVGPSCINVEVNRVWKHLTGEAIQLPKSTIDLIQNIISVGHHFQVEKTLSSSDHKVGSLYSSAVSEHARVGQSHEPYHSEYIGDSLEFIRQFDDLAYLRSRTFKVSIEPRTIQFQSVVGSVSQTVVVKYRAKRGDHGEQDFFLTVSPIEVFQLKVSHLKLQGEGLIEVEIQFLPTVMKTEVIEGSLSLIDKLGLKYASASLIAHKASFIKVSPLSLNTGWVIPGKSKTVTFNVENVSTVPAVIDINQPGLRGRNGTSFLLPVDQYKLQPSELRNVDVIFQPSHLGQFTTMINIHAPGGERLSVKVHGICGNPLATYVEDYESSKIGKHELAMERTQFMKRLYDFGLTSNILSSKLQDQERILLKTIIANMEDASSSAAVDFDFGIVPANTPELTRYLTLMNFSDELMVVGLYAQHEAIECEYLIEIPPRTARSAAVRLNIRQCLLSGPLETMLEIVCPEFQNLKCSITAYIGSPLSLLSWEYAFFTPCLIGQQSHINTVLVNQSMYTIDFIAQVVETRPIGASCFSSSLSTESSKPTEIAPHSILPVTFTFTPQHRGPHMQIVSIKMWSGTFSFDLAASIGGSPFHLIGICIQPYQQLADGEEERDRNNIDFLQTWISGVNRLLSDFPNDSIYNGLFDTSLSNQNNLENTASVISIKSSAVENFPLENNNAVSPQLFQIEAQASDDVGMKFLIPVPFTGSHSRRVLRPKEICNLEVNCSLAKLPPYATLFGFVAAVSEHNHTMSTVQLAANKNIEFYIFPNPNEITRSVTVDFGLVEVDSHPRLIKHVMLVNASSNTLNWAIKLPSSVTKYSPFSIEESAGEIQSMDAYLVPIALHVPSSGAYELVADVLVQDPLDNFGTSIKITKIAIKATCHTTHITGLPESLDFGTAIINHEKQQVFTIHNNGTSNSAMHILTQKPFSVTPTSFALSPGSFQNVTISILPQTSGKLQHHLLIFMNGSFHKATVSGTAGYAELICEGYNKRSIDFGLVSKKTIAWMNMYFTNIGTLPLQITNISSSSAHVLRMEFVQITNTIPRDKFKTKDSNDIIYQKDYWAMVKHNIQSIATSKHLSKETSFSRITSTRKKMNTKPCRVTPIQISHRNDDVAIQPKLSDTLLPLRPFYSYHFRLGFTSQCQQKTLTDLVLHYVPRLVDLISSPVQNPEIIKDFRLNVEGAAYQPLLFYPLIHDFGVVPAEMYSDYGLSTMAKNAVAKSRSLLEVVNATLQSQIVSILTIPPPYNINKQEWQLSPGEKVTIPIEFHPMQDQIKYKEDIIFHHKHGTTKVHLSGTGGCANITHDNCINFGMVKLNSITKRSLKIFNHGLLGTTVKLQLEPISHEFALIGESPYDTSCFVASGNSVVVDIKYTCKLIKPTPTSIKIAWQKTSSSVWDATEIPLIVDVGYPLLKINQHELDFGVTYINVGKTLGILLSNEGTASSDWHALIDRSKVSLDTLNGTILPKSSQLINITWLPTNMNQLETNIMFETEGKSKSLVCYGIVGVPSLQVELADLDMNFGIIEINTSHEKAMTLHNRSAKEIQYFVKAKSYYLDGAETFSDATNIYHFQPSQGSISPFSTASVTITATPLEYNSVVTLKFCILAMDGENYEGTIVSIGGKSIVRMSLFGSDHISDNSTKPLGSDGNSEIYHPGEGSETDKSVITTVPQHTLQSIHLALVSHIDILTAFLNSLVSTEGRRFELEMQTRSSQKASRPSTGVKSNAGTFEKRQYTPHNNNNSTDIDAGILNSTVYSNNLQLSLSKSRLSTTTVTFILDDLKSSISNILEVSKTFVNSLILNKDDKFSMFDHFPFINSTILSKSRILIQTIEDYISQTHLWTEGTNFFSPSLKLLKQSVGGIDNIIHPIPEESELPEFHLGLFYGGQTIKPHLLFYLPNLGNIPFEYIVQESIDHTLAPLSLQNDGSQKFFNLDPQEGIIKPGQQHAFNVKFVGFTSGLYIQSYDIQSGGKTILTFIVKANVGNPILQVNPDILDFGLVERNLQCTRTFTVSNIGSYKDTFYINRSTINSSTAIQENFTFDIKSSSITPGQETLITATFSPLNEGQYFESFTIEWLREPLSLAMRGIGGCSKLQIFDAVDGMACDHLSFGECLIGNTYEKLICIKNIGNCPGEYIVQQAASLTQLHFPNSHSSVCRINPEESIMVKVIFQPKDVGVIKEELFITHPTDNQEYKILVTAVCGEFSFDITGNLDFINTPAREIQVKALNVINTGDFTFHLDVQLEPIELLDTIVIEDLPDGGKKVFAKDSTEISLVATPKSIGIFEGVVKLSIIFKGCIKSTEIPFEFRTFVEPISLDSTMNVDVGKVAVGNSVSTLRTITNYGSKQVLYRLRIENLPASPPAINQELHKNDNKSINELSNSHATSFNGEGAIDGTMSNFWTIESKKLGFIDPGATEIVNIVFSPLTESKQLYEAVLILEISADMESDTWAFIQSFSLIGGCGRPIIHVGTELNFGLVPVGSHKKQFLTIENEGTASTEFEVIDDWGYNNVLSIESRTNGKLDPSSSVQLAFTFSPTEALDLKVDITIKFNTEKRIVTIKGEGCLYKISTPQLSQASIIEMHYNEEFIETIEIFNDCVLPVELKADIYKAVQEKEILVSTETIARSFTISPNPIILQPNSSKTPNDNERISQMLTISGTCSHPQDSNGFTDVAELVRSLTSNTNFYALKLSAPNTDPFLYFLFIKPNFRPLHISHNEGDDSTLPSNIEFGEVHYEEVVSKTVQIFNPNQFVVPIATHSTNTQIIVQSAAMVIQGHATVELIVSMVPPIYQHEEDIPLSNYIHAFISVTIPGMPNYSVALEATGTYIDLQQAPTFNPIDFGEVYNDTVAIVEFSFKNWTRRPLEYTLRMDVMSTDVFSLPQECMVSTQLIILPSVRFNIITERANILF